MPFNGNAAPALELLVTSPVQVRDAAYALIGVVRTGAGASWLLGSSVCIRSLITGLMDEAFLDEGGAFAQDLELRPESDNALELTVCDGEGAEAARMVVTIRCHSEGKPDAEPLPVALLPRRSRALEPPWPRFAQLARRCLDLAVEAAKATGRPADELFEHVHAQQRYAEQAFEEQNQTLYQECHENLDKYAVYLDQLKRDALPRPHMPQLPPEVEAKDSVVRFRNELATVWKQVRAKQRIDLEPRLAEIARQAHGFTQRMKSEPLAVVRDARRLFTEVHKIEQELDSQPPPPGEEVGPLEGTS